MTFQTTLTAERIARHTRDGYWRNRTITDYCSGWAGSPPIIATDLVLPLLPLWPRRR